MTERVLVVAAHPDDEVLGCGGTIARHVMEGDLVEVLIMADGAGSRPGPQEACIAERKACAARACGVLGVKDVTLLQYWDNRMDHYDRLDVVKDIECQISAFDPTVVYTHHGSDANIDHRIVNDAVVVACRPLPGRSIKRLLFFEVPSATEWSIGRAAFAPNYFVDVKGTMQQKLLAFAEYGSEVRDFPHPRSRIGIEQLATWRGVSAGMKAAEAFVLGRWLC